MVLVGDKDFVQLVHIDDATPSDVGARLAVYDLIDERPRLVCDVMERVVQEFVGKGDGASVGPAR